MSEKYIFVAVRSALGKPEVSAVEDLVLLGLFVIGYIVAGSDWGPG